MTIFEMFTNGMLDEFELKGVLKPKIIESCKAYKLFLSFRNDGKKYDESIELTADYICTSPRSIKRAISLVTK